MSHTSHILGRDGAFYKNENSYLIFKNVMEKNEEISLTVKFLKFIVNHNLYCVILYFLKSKSNEK